MYPPESRSPDDKLRQLLLASKLARTHIVEGLHGLRYGPGVPTPMDLPEGIPEAWCWTIYLRRLGAEFAGDHAHER